MVIGSVSNSIGAYQTNKTSNSNSVKQNSQNSDDESNAQSAFAILLQNLNNSTGSSVSTNSTITADLQSLNSALQSGDEASAQKALSKLQTDMKSLYGNHHHKGGGDDTDSTSSTTSTTSTTSQDALESYFSSIANAQSSSGNSSDSQSASDSSQSNNGTVNLLTGNDQTNQVLLTLQNTLQSGNISSSQNSNSVLSQYLQNASSVNAIGSIIDMKS